MAAFYNVSLRSKYKNNKDNEFCGSGIDQDGFKLVHINDVLGYGVYTTRNFTKGEFLLEYPGERISKSIASEREEMYTKNNVGCYIYYDIIGKCGKFCIDATNSLQLGRYVNDSPHKTANVVMRKFVCDEVYLAMYALRDIEAGTELRYDYGDDPASMKWREQTEYLQPTKLLDLKTVHVCQTDGYESDVYEYCAPVLSSVLPTSPSDDVIYESDVEEQVSMELLFNVVKIYSDDVESGRPITKVGSTVGELDDLFFDDDVHFSVAEDVINTVVGSTVGELDDLFFDDDVHFSVAEDVINTVVSSSPNHGSNSPTKDLETYQCISPQSSVHEQVLMHDSGILLGNSLGDVINSDEESIILHEDENRALSVLIKQKKKKIHRPCLFCKNGKLFSALTRHLKTFHKGEAAVIKAISLPKREQIDAFDRLRKEGILSHNMEEMKKETPIYVRERTSANNNSESGNLFICSSCKGCYAKHYKSRHQIHCGRNTGQVMVPLIPLESLTCLDELDSDFKIVINKMILDEVSTMAKTDPIILMVGARVFKGNKCKTEKKYETEKRVRNTMRLLARLYIEFEKVHSSSFKDASCMFLRESLPHLRSSIERLTGDNHGMKYGLKIQLQNLLKFVAKMLQAHFLVNGDSQKADAVRDFITVFALVENEVFGDAVYQVTQKRNKSTRKPASLPNEDTVKLLNEYIKKVTGKSYLSFEYPGQIFVEVRDAACARLTIYNGRRGGEPARLFIYQWTEAVDGTWLREETRISYKKEIDTGNRITFQEGKGNKQVPVFIPPDVIPAMEFLSNSEVRKNAEVPECNTYMFPSTKGSENHVSGWHALMSCCKNAKLVDTVTGTMNRHRVATLIGGLGLPEAEQQLAFDHFGHSGDVNRNIYQVPQAERQLNSTGRYLQLIDQNNASQNLVAATNSSSSSSSTLPYSQSKLKLKADVQKVAPKRNTARIAAMTNKQQRTEREGDKSGNEDVYLPSSEETDVDDDCGSDDDTNDCPKRNRYFRWSASLKKKFQVKFQTHIDADYGYPGRQEMETFGNENNISYTRVRTRITNERATRKKKQQAQLKKNRVLMEIE